MVYKEEHPATQTTARKLQLFGYLAVFCTFIVAAIARSLYISKNAESLDPETKKLDWRFSFTRVEWFNEWNLFNVGFLALIAMLPLLWTAPSKSPVYIQNVICPWIIAEIVFTLFYWTNDRLRGDDESAFDYSGNFAVDITAMVNYHRIYFFYAKLNALEPITAETLED